MSITVKPENEAYLKSLVADGLYSSIDEAADAAIAMHRIEDSDLSWVKPYVEPALASLDEGNGVPFEEAFATVRAHMEARRK